MKEGFLGAMDALKGGVSSAIGAISGFFGRLWNIDLAVQVVQSWTVSWAV